MQQRMKQLENDLEDTRLQLFTSEEARADLEARINSDACVEGSARTRHSIEYNGVEQLNYHESILTREEDHQQEISRLHQYYKGIIDQDKEENKLLHEKLTQFNDLSDSIDCVTKRHKAELQHREGLLLAQHKEENLKQLKDHSDLLKSIEKRHQTALENTKDKVREFYWNLGAHRSERHKREMAELQDVFQAELRLTSEDYEAEKARTLKFREAEHQAEVAEFNALLRTHQALVKEHETMRSAHHAEIEAMKTGTSPPSIHRLSPSPPPPAFLYTLIPPLTPHTGYETAIETYETKLLGIHERLKQDLAEMKEVIQSVFSTHRKS